MKRLVVLVGLPGSGKAAFRKRHPEWAVVSKDVIRREVFRCTYAPEHEETVDRVFAATLVEVVDSEAEVVCVDDLSLTRGARADLLELAQIAGRRPIAYVMPSAPIDVLQARVERSAVRMTAAEPDLRVVPLPRDRLAELARSYDPVDAREGFARVEEVAEPVDAEPPEPARKTTRRKRVERRDPLPLFVP
jgi:predicted kinase